jgi:pimeloyl-ACP methyl ester carboxylesterase
MSTPDAAFGLSENSTTVRSPPRSVRVPVAVRWVMREGSRFAPAVTARLAQQLFFKPMRTLPKPEQLAVLSRGTSFSVRARECVVRGWTFAARPSVLLVHGWGGNAGQMSAFVGPLLERGYGVVVADMPGHGRSSGRLTSLVHYAAALRAVSEHVGGVHAVIAHSFGAAGTTLALRDGLDVARVVYVAPPARFSSFWDRFRAGVEVSEPVFARMVTNAERWLEVSFANVVPEHIAPTMTTPLLVVHDAADREVDVAEGEHLTRLWPGAQLRTTAGLGHMRILKDAATVTAIADWIAA